VSERILKGCPCLLIRPAASLKEVIGPKEFPLLSASNGRPPMVSGDRQISVVLFPNRATPTDG